MHRLVLEWVEEGRDRSQAFSFNSTGEQSIRIGRDDRQCNLVIKDATLTVSGLHVEIFFNSRSQNFCLRNLTKNRQRPNPAWVNGQKIVEQEADLNPGATIQLGKVKLRANIMAPQPKPIYGLKCHICNRVSPRADLSLVCRWCGTSLVAAVTEVYYSESP